MNEEGFGCNTLQTEPPPFAFLSEEEKRRLYLNRVKPLKSPQLKLLNKSIFCQTGLFECEYPLFEKPMVTTEPAVASARLLHLNYFLAKCCACSTKILFDSCKVFLKHLFSHPASRASLCLLGLGGEMEALPKSRPTFAEVAAGQSSGLVNLVFSRQTVIFFRMRA